MALDLLIEDASRKAKISFSKVDCAFDGLDGLKKLKLKLGLCCRTPYKLIFVDLNMPRMNGIEMTKEVRR